MAFDERGLGGGQTIAKPPGKVYKPAKPKVPFGSTSTMPTYGKPQAPENPVYQGIGVPFGQNFNQRGTRTTDFGQYVDGIPRNPTGGNVPTGGGGGGGAPSGSDPGVFPTDPGIAAAPVPPPVIPDYKDDSEFIAALADLKLALGDYMAGYDQSLSQYGKGVNTTFDRIGWDPATKSFINKNVNPDTLWNQSREGMMNDLASRGMLNSGGLPEGLGKLQRDYGNRVSDITTAQGDFKDSKKRELNSYENQNRSQQAAAKRAAAQRIAQGLGLPSPAGLDIPNANNL